MEPKISTAMAELLTAIFITSGFNKDILFVCNLPDNRTKIVFKDGCIFDNIFLSQSEMAFLLSIQFDIHKYDIFSI